MLWKIVDKILDFLEEHLPYAIVSFFMGQKSRDNEVMGLEKENAEIKIKATEAINEKKISDSLSGLSDSEVIDRAIDSTKMPKS